MLTDPALLKTHAFSKGQWIAADRQATYPISNQLSVRVEDGAQR